MTEPRFIPANEAKAMLEGSQEQREWWPDVLTPVEESAHDLAHTVIAQAAQIKRLQAAVTALMADLNESDFGLYSEYETRSTPPFQPRTLDEYLTAEDMEGTDD